MKEELISVIVPVYNVEKYLNRCIDSILNQTYTNIEIILVDDGSTDNSGNICDEYARKDKRIKVIHKENGGLSDARNKGIDIANGKYIGFIDSDDWILPTMYQILYNILLKYKADISICDFIQTDDVKVVEQPKNRKIKLFNKDRAIRELIANNKIKDYAWNKLYRIELFKNIRYPFGKNMEDKGTTYKLFLESERIVCTDSIQYIYFYRENSIVNQINYKLISDDISLTIERYNALKIIYPNMKLLSTRLFQLIVRCYYSAIKNDKKEIIQLCNQEKYFNYITDKIFFIDLKTLLQFIIIKMRGY